MVTEVGGMNMMPQRVRRRAERLRLSPGTVSWATSRVRLGGRSAKGDRHRQQIPRGCTCLGRLEQSESPNQEVAWWGVARGWGDGELFNWCNFSVSQDEEC